MDQPHEKFYFFAPDFDAVPLPAGRRLYRLDSRVMLTKKTPGPPDTPYFRWKLARHVTGDEMRNACGLFLCGIDA